MAYNYLKKIAYFYPRPPRGGRLDSDFRSLWDKLFLSTPSARRATSRYPGVMRKFHYFYPRPPRGGRRRTTSLLHPHINFYPRPPRGGRRGGKGALVQTEKFLSTPSARRATLAVWIAERKENISIHALREEGDTRTRPMSTALYDFYPRPPRGGRPALNTGIGHGSQFLSTPSARRATR